MFTIPSLACGLQNERRVASLQVVNRQRRAALLRAAFASGINHIRFPGTMRGARFPVRAVTRDCGTSLVRTAHASDGHHGPLLVLGAV